MLPDRGFIFIAALLASLSFLGPQWAGWFALAVGGPMLAHLMSKRGGRLTLYPTVRFVQQAMADTARLMRVRHWLLLLMRMVALCLLVLAFMQPIWRYESEAGISDQGYLLIAIVDRTASMQRTAGGATLYDDARRQVREMLRQLDPQRDVAVVVMLGSQPTSLLPEPSANTELLVDRLASAPATLEHGSLADAVALAMQVSRRSDNARAMRVEIFTDAQQTQMQEDWQAMLPAQAMVQLHTLEAGSENLAVFEPVSVPTQPIAGQPATVSARVANFSSTASQATVTLRVGDVEAGQVHRQQVHLGPWQQTQVSFRAVFDLPGMTQAYWQIEGPGSDALAADDATGQLLDVLPARNVVLVTAGDPADLRSASYFLARAIDPGREVGGAGVALTIAKPEAVAQVIREFAGAGAGPMVVMLAEAGAVPADSRRALLQHLEAGGGVIWFIDDAAAGASLQAFGKVAGRVPIFVSPTDPSQPASAAGGKLLASGRFDHEVLRVFEGPARASLLASRLTQPTVGTLGPEADLLLSYDDGSPALALQWMGAGRLAVLAGGLDPAATDFVKGPAFVPLLHQLIRHIAPGERALPNAHPGETLVVDVEAEAGVHVVSPSGAQLPAAQTYVAGEVGLYAFVSPGDLSLAGGQWVELDAAESDLRVGSDEQGADADAQPQATVAGRMNADALTLRPRVIELWRYFAAACVLMLVAELAMLIRLGDPGREAGDGL